MDNSSSSGHPLHIAWAQVASVTFEVFVAHFVLQHVSDSLKASVRVIREPTWEAHTEVVKHEEGLHLWQFSYSYHSSYFGAVSLWDFAGLPLAFDLLIRLRCFHAYALQS